MLHIRHGLSLSLSLSSRLLRLVKCSDVGAYFSGLIYQTNAQTRHKLGIPILRRRLVKVVWGWSSAAPGGRQPPRNYHDCNVGVEPPPLPPLHPLSNPCSWNANFPFLSLSLPLSSPLSLSLRRPEATSPNLLRNAGIFFNPCFSQAASRPRQRRGNDDFIRKWPWREYVLIRRKLVFFRGEKDTFAATFWKAWKSATGCRRGSTKWIRISARDLTGGFCSPVARVGQLNPRLH